MATGDLGQLADQLAKATVKVEGVSFEGRSLKLDNEDDAKEVVEAIKACKNLHYLKLEGNTLGVNAAKAIAKALECHPELKRAQWKDLFTGRMKTEIPKALQFLGGGLVLAGTRLVELDLSDNAFGPIGVEGLAVLLRSSSCFDLKELRLNNNGLGTAGGKLLAKALLDCYNSSKGEGKALALQVFIAGRNRLEDEGAKALANVFKTLGSLLEIAMPQNGIYHGGMTAIADSLISNQNLRILNLNDNTIGVKGAASLASAMPYLQHLKVLNFGDCLLKTKGALLIAASLTNGHAELEELNLGFNEIKSQGGVAVACAVKSMTRLKHLFLGGNQFGETGRTQLKVALINSGREDALGSLSEDEDEDEDDEDEDEDEANDLSEDDEDEENEFNTSHQNKSVELREILQVTEGITNNQDKTNQCMEYVKCSVPEFLKSPTAEAFLGLGNNRNQLILEEVKAQPPECYMDKLMQTIMKVSALTVSSLDTARAAAFSCCEGLYEEFFKWADRTDQLSVANNILLIHLNLIKSEDKYVIRNWNLEGSMLTLAEAAQREYFPKTTRQSLQAFLSRPNVKADDFPAAKHKLMQRLFQF